MTGLHRQEEGRGVVGGWSRRWGSVSLWWLTVIAVCTSILCPRVLAQEGPYIVTYDHVLEKPHELEVAYFSTMATQRGGNAFHAYWVEFEYGAASWWTTEVYLDGQTTFHDSSLFTGFRWENRFRLQELAHAINSVIYVEYEQISEADKTLREIEGHDIESNEAPRNAVLQRTYDHELELKLLLSRTWKGWNVAVNPLATKNLSPSNPWEFGYAMGLSRPLGLMVTPNRCNVCPQNFVVGVELYGGLGDARIFGLKDTSHYLAPVAAWNLPSGWTLRLSPGVGLNGDSHRLLIRWGIAREL